MNRQTTAGPSRWRITRHRGGSALAALVVGCLALSTSVACGSSEPALPRVDQFRGPDCAAVAGPSVQVAAAVRALSKKPDKDAAPLGQLTDAQNRLRALPVGSASAMPEVQALVTSIGLFRLRVDTHSADDAALQDVGSSNDRLVRRCTT